MASHAAGPVTNALSRPVPQEPLPIRKWKRQERVQRLLHLHERLLHWRPNCRFSVIRSAGDVVSTSLAGGVLLYAALRAAFIL